MMINVRELSTKGNEVRLQERLDISEIVRSMPEIVRSEPLDVQLVARCASALVEVSGTLQAEMEFVCGKCLQPFSHRWQIPFHESFSLTKDGHAGAEEADEDDESVHFVTASNVALDPYVMENVLLALPYIPICREDCKGLCPVCGGNRNEADCGCPQDTADPRLAGLKDFFKD